MKQHYKKHIADLEEETGRLKAEKGRLVDKLKLPESERASLAQQENDIAALKRRYDDAEARCADLIDENAELKQEVVTLSLCLRNYNMRGSYIFFIHQSNGSTTEIKSNN